MQPVPLRVLHVIASLAPSRGGTTSSVLQMVEGLRRAGVTVDIAATDDDGPDRRLAPDAPERELAGRHYFERRTRFYSWSPQFSTWIGQRVRDYDLVHIHGLFSHVNIAAGFAAARQGVPYILTPHGMAGAYPLLLKPWRKRLSMALLERRLLRKAASIHLTSGGELADFKALGINAPTALIPLGFDPPPPGNAARFFEANPRLSGKRIVVFLGRLDPIKNLEMLIDAWTVVSGSQADIALVVAGSGDSAYVNSLKQRAAINGMDDQIVFTGFVEGDGKADLLAAAACLVLPSHYESFGMAALEGLAAGLPLVLTQRVGLASDLAAISEVEVVAPQVQSLAAGIACGLSRSKDQAGADMLHGRFSLPTVTDAMAGLYRRVGRA